MLLTLFSVIGGFLFGYDTGVMSGAAVFCQDDLKLRRVVQGAYRYDLLSITPSDTCSCLDAQHARSSVLPPSFTVSQCLQLV